MDMEVGVGDVPEVAGCLAYHPCLQRLPCGRPLLLSEQDVALCASAHPRCIPPLVACAVIDAPGPLVVLAVIDKSLPYCVCCVACAGGHGGERRRGGPSRRGGRSGAVGGSRGAGRGGGACCAALRCALSCCAVLRQAGTSGAWAGGQRGCSALCHLLSAVGACACMPNPTPARFCACSPCVPAGGGGSHAGGQELPAPRAADAAAAGVRRHQVGARAWGCGSRARQQPACWACPPAPGILLQAALSAVPPHPPHPTPPRASYVSPCPPPPTPPPHQVCGVSHHRRAGADCRWAARTGSCALGSGSQAGVGLPGSRCTARVARAPLPPLPAPCVPLFKPSPFELDVAPCFAPSLTSQLPRAVLPHGHPTLASPPPSPAPACRDGGAHARVPHRPQVPPAEGNHDGKDQGHNQGCEAGRAAAGAGRLGAAATRLWCGDGGAARSTCLRAAGVPPPAGCPSLTPGSNPSGPAATRPASPLVRRDDPPADAPPAPPAPAAPLPRLQPPTTRLART